jgi:hypothetical protein
VQRRVVVEAASGSQQAVFATYGDKIFLVDLDGPTARTQVHIQDLGEFKDTRVTGEQVRIRMRWPDG